MSHVFSDTQDVDDPVAHCDPNIIPIFPLRFALTIDAVLDMLKSDATPDTATSIHGLSQHELLRIRRGYVYIFANNSFQVFYFDTQINDENGCFYRPDTPTPSNGQPYIFNKYSWPDGPQGKWEPEDKTYPYAFVPKQTPVAWVAYSEARWPYRWLFEAETNPGFRNKIMTEVNLDTRQGGFCAPLSELEQRVPAFRKNSVDFDIQDYSIANAIRHTSVEVEHQAAVVHCTNASDKGVLVALHDPIGEIQDTLALMAIHSQTLANYVADHQYPMVIGKAVKNYHDKDKVSTSEWGFLNIDGPLIRDFETEYCKIVQQADDLEAAQEGLIAHWARKTAQSGTGSIMQRLDLCLMVAESYSLKAHPNDHLEILNYWLLLYCRMMNCTAYSQTAAHTLVALFDPATPKAPNKDILGLVIANTQKALSLAATAIKTSGQYAKPLAPAINAIFTVYGTEVVRAATGPYRNATNQLTRAIFVQQSTRFHQPDELSQAFANLMKKEGYGGTPLPDNVQQYGTNISATRRLTAAVDNPNQIGLIEFHAQVDISLDADYLAHAARGNNFELGSNGIGMVAAGLSLYTTVAEWNDSRRDASDIGAFISHPATRLTAAFADAFSSTHNVAIALANRGSQATTKTVLQQVFVNKPALNNSVAGAASKGTRSIAVRSMAGAARVLGMVGVAISALTAIEGYHRGDSAMVVGNGLMALGGFVLALGLVTGPAALVVLAIIGIGLAISLFAYDDVERWVKEGFWGSSDDYWNDKRELLIKDQVEAAKALANQKASGNEKIKQGFEDELAWFLDINSQLTIEDAEKHDGRVEVHCGTLRSAADLPRLTVRAKYSTGGIGRRGRWIDIPGVTLEWVRTGTVVVRIPAGNYNDTHVTITARMQRIPNGSFKPATHGSIDLW